MSDNQDRINQLKTEVYDVMVMLDRMTLQAQKLHTLKAQKVEEINRLVADESNIKKEKLHGEE